MRLALGRLKRCGPGKEEGRQLAADENKFGKRRHKVQKGFQEALLCSVGRHLLVQSGFGHVKSLSRYFGQEGNSSRVLMPL